jgi:uncharacterized protein (DUF1778 family)
MPCNDERNTKLRRCGFLASSRTITSFSSSVSQAAQDIVEALNVIRLATDFIHNLMAL